MRPLNAEEIIRACELGQGQTAAERAITILSAAFPEKRVEDLRTLSLGQRNLLLLKIRERLFGPELNCFSVCPGCCERLEFTFSTAAINGAPAIESAETLESAAAVEMKATKETEFSVEAEGYVLRFRPLNSLDLNAAARGASISDARRILAERSVLEARRGDEVIAAESLPVAVINHLIEGLARCDPQAEVLIDLECPACGALWQTPIDIPQFLYAELSAQARRLLREVHTLARAYAWREADILAMSARRRQSYLEMLGQ